jgi:hypothetical protein
MASQPATMAATARAAEARETWIPHIQQAETAPYLSGWRAAAAGLLVLGVAALVAVPAVTALGSVVDATAWSRAAAWLARLAPAAPVMLTARAVVALVAVVAISRADGQR